MSELLNEFFQYLKKPRRITSSQGSLADQVLEVIQLFVITFVAVILLVMPLMTLIGADQLPNKLSELENLGFDEPWKQHLALFSLAVVAAPLIEELIFRFPLKYRRGAIFLATMCVVVLLANVLQLFGLSFEVSTFSSLVFGGVLGGIFFLKIKSPEALDNFSFKYFPYFFYMAALLFAFVHVFNYELKSDQFWMGPILVLPQLVLGLMLGYVRIKYGLWASILVHAMNNTIPTLAIIFMPEGGLQ